MSNQQTMAEKAQHEEQKLTDNSKTLSETAFRNLSELDLTLVTTSAYFKPEPEKTYVIQINPEDKVKMVKNPKFADKDGNIPTRFEFQIKHVNNNADQIFTTSKTLCKQIVTELGKGFTVLELTRHGSDRGTIYDVIGVQ